MENTKVFMKRTENSGDEKTKKLQLNTLECQGAGRQGDRGLETRRGHGWQKIYAETYVLFNHD